jgi:hypothetical protein
MVHNTEYCEEKRFLYVFVKMHFHRESTTLFKKKLTLSLGAAGIFKKW